MKNTVHTLTANQYCVIHPVAPREEGTRLDVFLKERYPKRSRVKLQNAIQSGVVSIRCTETRHRTLGQPKPSSSLVFGDEVWVLSEKKKEPPVNFQYEVLFEDPYLLVINKPANLPVHPAGRYFFNTLLIHLKTAGHKNPLYMHTPNERADGEIEKDYYLVHRIDKETSGVLVLAKTKWVCTQLSRQFSERHPKKKYFAIVKGICPEVFEMHLSVKRSSRSFIRIKMMCIPEEAEIQDGQFAHTLFKRIRKLNTFSLVECTPITGRQHQIRVHLEAAGYPLVGDKLYGWTEEEALRFYEADYLTPEAEAKLLLPRHALHATELHLIHPILKKEMHFSSPLPEDLEKFIHTCVLDQ